MTKFYIAGENHDHREELIRQLYQFGDEVTNMTARADEIIVLPGGIAENYRRDFILPVCEAHRERLADGGFWKLVYDGGDEPSVVLDPELARLLAEEEEIERATRAVSGPSWGGTLNTEGLHADSPSAITTYTRKRVDPLNMCTEDFDIEDIAHALARQCRYNGHVGGFLSVARHSLWVSHRLKPHGPELELWGLLHDAGEAYIGDMVKPLKHDPSMRVFRDVEDALDEVLAFAFGLSFPMPPEVKEADRFVTVEAEIGMRLKDTHYSTVDEDEHDFLGRFYDLAGGF